MDLLNNLAMPANPSQILLYNTEDGKTQIQVTLQEETVWLTQAQMAELFQRKVPTINEHIKNIYEEGELDQTATIRKSRIVQTEGKRKVTRDVDFYNLDVIISVGYRVKSHRGTQFRIWATQRLREYIVKGFVMDDERLEKRAPNYFDELVERVRRIRTSERNFYEKVRDIFATSIDYDPKTDYAKQFYAVVQNKFHYAIHGHTAAELIAKRVDSSKEHMGLTNWSGKIITSSDAKVAKNYLEELELKRLELLVEQFLSFAELRSVERIPMYMSDWLKKLDGFLILNEKEILTHAGKVSHKEMEAKVRKELEKFNKKTTTKQIEGPKDS
jgi:hypothetical protein